MGRTKEQQREYMKMYRARNREKKAERESYIIYDEPAKPTGYLQGALDRARTRTDGAVSSDYFAADDAQQLRVQLRALGDERDRLAEEVRHLKEELAKRPLSVDSAYLEVMDCHPYTCDHCEAEFHTENEYVTHLGWVERTHGGTETAGFNTRPFRPVPKKGK